MWGAIASVAGGALSGLLGGGKDKGPQKDPYDDHYRESLYFANNDIYNRATGIANQPYQRYPDMRFAPTNDLQQQGINKIAGAANQDSPLLGAANQQAINTLQGGGFREQAYNPFAGSNPYLGEMIRSAQNDTADAYARGTAAQTDAAASRANALGSSGYNELTRANQGELVKRLGEISSGARFNDYTMQAQLGESALNRSQSAYDNERANQLRAMSLAPNQSSATQNFGFNAGNALMGVGNFMQGEQQKGLDFRHQEYTDAMELPYKNLNMLASVTPGYQSGQPYQPMQSNTAANVLGGAAMGYGLYNQMSQPQARAQQPGVTGWNSGYDLPMGGQQSSWNPFSSASNWFNF